MHAIQASIVGLVLLAAGLAPASPVRQDPFSDFVTGYAHLRMSLALQTIQDAQASSTQRT